MWFEHEAPSIGVDERMALAPVDLLARVIAARPTSLGCLDALAVDDRTSGAGLSSDPFAIEHDQGVIDKPYFREDYFSGGRPMRFCPYEAHPQT